jgi:hypothetical protein
MTVPRRARLVALCTGPALVATAAVAMLAWTWMVWPDPISDSGRELYIPWQLASGKVLYRDVAHFNGPLSQYVNALAFVLLGASLRVQVVANLVVLAIVAVLIHRGAEEVGGRLAAAAAGLVYMTTFAFGPLTQMGSFSFLAPYSHEVTHGAVLLLVLMLWLFRFQRSGRRREIVAMGLTLGLLFLTKPELWLAGAAGAGTGVGLTLLRDRGGWRHAGILLGALAGSTAVPPLLAWGLLSLAMPAGQAGLGVLGAWKHLLDPRLSEMLYFRYFMGTSDPWESLRALGAWTLKYAAVLGPAAALAYGFPRGSRAGRWVAAGLCAGLGTALVAWRDSIDWLEALRPLPLLLVGTGGAWAAALRRHWRDRARSLALSFRLSLAVLSLVLLLRMTLYARAWHYGFVLALPGTMLLVAVAAGSIPRAIENLGGHGWVFRAAVGALLAGAVAGHLSLIHGVLQGRPFTAGTGGDSFRTDERGRLAAAIVEQLTTRSGPNETLAVLPDGVMINYLARRSNPTPYVIGNPVDMTVFGEDRMLAAYAARPPDFIALVHCDTAIYGYRFFGQDYAVDLGSWIRAHYETVGLAGSPPFQDERFGILLLRRKSPPPTASAYR